MIPIQRVWLWADSMFYKRWKSLFLLLLFTFPWNVLSLGFLGSQFFFPCEISSLASTRSTEKVRISPLGLLLFTHFLLMLLHFTLVATKKWISLRINMWLIVFVIVAWAKKANERTLCKRENWLKCSSHEESSLWWWHSIISCYYNW